MSRAPKTDAPEGKIPTGVEARIPSSTVFARSQSNSSPQVLREPPSTISFSVSRMWISGDQVFWISS